MYDLLSWMHHDGHFYIWDSNEEFVRFLDHMAVVISKRPVIPVTMGFNLYEYYHGTK